MAKAAIASVEFDGDFSKLEKDAKGEQGKLEKSFGASFKKIAEVGAALLAGAAVGLVAVGVKFEDSFDTIARGTGATGKTLAGLDQSFKDVLKSGSGSFDQVSQSITTLFQRTGLTGKALDDFAAKEVALGEITKTDVGQNVQETTALFNLFGVAVGKQSGELDVLFKASQIAGVTITQLASDMQSAAPTAKILGLTFDQTASLVANLDKAGLPASRVMTALASSFAKAAKAGKDPLSVIQDLVTAVKAAPNATDAASIAISKFGISARQASILVAGIRSGAIDLNATLGAGKGIAATAAATQTLSMAFQHLKNEALVGLEPLATRALGALTTGITAITPALTSIITFAGTALDKFGTVLVDHFAGPIERAFQLVELAWIGVKAGFAHPDAALAGFGPVATFIIGAGQDIRKAFDGISTVVGQFGTDFDKLIHSTEFTTTIGLLVRGFDFLQTTVETVFGVIQTIIAAVGPPVIKVFDKLQSLFDSNTGARVAITAAAVASLAAALVGLVAVGPALLGIGSQVSSLIQGVKASLDLITSPIGLTVLAIAALAAAFFVAYNRSKTFRDIVDQVTASIKKVDWDKVFKRVSGDVVTAVGAIATAVGAVTVAVEAVVGFFQREWPTITTFVSEVAQKLQPIVAQIGQTFGALVDAVRAVMKILIPIIEVALLLAELFWKRFGDHIKQFVAESFNAVLSIIRGALQIVQGVFEIFAGIFTLNWSKTWGGIKDVFAGVFDVLAGIVENAFAAIELAFFVGFGLVLGVINLAKSLIAKAWDSVWSGLGTAVDALWGVVERAFGNGVNAVIDILNGLIRAYKDTFGHLPGAPHISSLAHVSFGVTHTTAEKIGGPRFANGGLITSPQLGLLGENPSTLPEVVSPVATIRKIVTDVVKAHGSQSQTIDARIEVHGNVNGVDDLDRWADLRDRKLMLALQAG